MSLSFAASGFVLRKLYANLGRAAGQADDSVFPVMWNPSDQTSPALALSGRGPFSAPFCFGDIAPERSCFHAAERRDPTMHALRIYFTIAVYTHYVHADSRPALFVEVVFN